MSFAMLGSDCCCPYYTPLGLRLGLLPGPGSAPLLLGHGRRGHGCEAAVPTAQGRLGLARPAEDEVVKEAGADGEMPDACSSGMTSGVNRNDP